MIMQGYEDIIYEKEDHLAIITLNRPAKLNAITMPMRKSLLKAFDDVHTDDNVRVLIVTGSGRGFCSGEDVGFQADLLVQPFEKQSRRLKLQNAYELGPILPTIWKPVIAAVNGVAAGAGLSIAAESDIRIASEQARFSSIFVRRGLIPDNSLTWFLPRLVGLSKAYEMMWTGDMIDAKEALRIGLVSRVVPHDRLMADAKELANRIAEGPPMAIELTKHAVQRALGSDLGSQLEHEWWTQQVCMASEDHAEGVKAFQEKREPRFKGS